MPKAFFLLRNQLVQHAADLAHEPLKNAVTSHKVRPLDGAAGGAIGPWVAGFLADLSTSATGVMSRIGDAIPSDGGSGLRAGILITTVFPITVVVVATILHRVTTGRAKPGQPDVLSPMDAVGRSY